MVNSFKKIGALGKFKACRIEITYTTIVEYQRRTRQVKEAAGNKRMDIDCYFTHNAALPEPIRSPQKRFFKLRRTRKYTFILWLLE